MIVSTFPASAQEAFNRVWTAFVVEKRPLSFDSQSEECLYRGPNGSACAAGLCIPDSVYRPEMENLPASVVCFTVPEAAPLKDFVKLLRRLQNAHDSAARQRPNSDLEAQLREIAETFNLEIPDNA